MAEARGGAQIARGPITFCVILAVIMQALDTTIANVALPFIQGTVAASSDQINWVLTSYIVAAAIMTPPSGWLARRYGRERILMGSVAGFVFASVLCGLSTSLTEIVLARVLQGVLGAAMAPLAQAILLDIYPAERRGQAMAMFGISVMVGPIMGPMLGGWLTDNIGWQWVFFVNVPLGVATLFGLAVFVKGGKGDPKARLDWAGFILLSIAVGSFQLMLDRGEQLDWFSASEIWMEAIVAATAFYLFVVHILTAERPFIDPKLFLDRNYALGVSFIFVVGVILLASLALIAPYLQSLMGYPVLTAGIVMGPRGVGTMLSMFLVGRLIGKTDIRLMLAIGFALTAVAMDLMTGWTPDISAWTVVWTGFVQGAGLGLLFVPLTTITYSTLPAAARGEAAGLQNLSRNLGSSVGISIVSALLTRNAQIVHADLTEYVSPFNHALQALGSLNPTTASGAASLESMIVKEATVIAYIDDFKFLAVLALVAIPFLVSFRTAARKPA